jgi:hypothetical protein
MSTRNPEDDRRMPFEDANLSKRWTRRGVIRSGTAGAAGLISAASLTTGRAATGGSSRALRGLHQEEPVRGGRLRVAATGQPAGLDMHFTNQRTVTMIGWQMYEALFTFDGAYETVRCSPRATRSAKTS